MNSQQQSFDVENALKTPTGRITAIILIEAYLAMLTSEERLHIFKAFCQHCGAIGNIEICCVTTQSQDNYGRC